MEKPLPRKPRSQPASPPANQSRSLVVFWAGICGLLLLPRQVCWPDFWWDLARGRANVLGSFSPAQDLLLAAQQPEANWLSGLPLFSVYLLFGVVLTAGIVLVAKFLLAAFTLWPLFQYQRLTLRSLVLIPLLILLIREGITSIGGMSATVMMLLTLRWLPARCDSVPASAFYGLCTGAFWAGFAPGAPWCPVCIMMSGPRFSSSAPKIAGHPIPADQSPDHDFRLPAAGGCSAGLILTPAGLEGGLDQFRYCFAELDDSWRLSQSALVSEDFLSLQGSYPLLLALLAALIGLLGADRLRATSIFSSDSLQKGILVTLPMTMAALNQQFLAAASVWAVCLLTPPQPMKRSAPLTTSPAWRYSLAGMLLLCMVVDSFGRGPLTQKPWGWGLAQELDLRLLDELPNGSPEVPATVATMDGRTTGIAAWLSPSLQPIDHPRVAFDEHRLAQWLRVQFDLREDHRAEYRLPDGSVGGWYRVLQKWNTRYLLIPVEKQVLLQAVQRTDWNIIDLDSPNIPFAMGDAIPNQQRIATVAGEQDFVQFGQWHPDADVYSGLGQRFAITDLIAGVNTGGAALRQARLFRVLNLEMAALRSLGPLRPLSTPAAVQELVLAQQDLAWVEWNNFGRPCRFRSLLLQQADVMGFRVHQPPWNSSSEQPTAYDSEILAAAQIYLNGTAGQARQRLSAISSDAADIRYAVAMLYLEDGILDDADAIFQDLIDQETELPLRQAAAWWKQRIDSYLHAAIPGNSPRQILPIATSLPGITAQPETLLPGSQAGADE